MRSFPALPLFLLAAAFAAPVPASDGDPAAPARASLSLSRHHTTNALDSTLALSDWYTLLRGGVERTFEHEIGATRLAGEFELRRFDTYAFEDDAAAGLSVTTTLRPSAALELRGTLSLGLVSEGDDLAVGDVLLATRTRRATFAAAVQAGLRLSADTVLVLDAGADRERPAGTLLPGSGLGPVRLEPRRDRVRLAATLTRTHGPVAYGALVAAGLLRTGPVGLLPQLRIADYGARLHLRITAANGAALSASAGIEALALAGGPLLQVRPAYELAAETPLPAGFSIRGALAAAYDRTSKDDPLAVRVRRYQAEAGWRAAAVLRFGAGLYVERRDNVGLGTRERRRGVYGEAVWQARERLAVTLRVDATRHAFQGLDARRRAVDIRLGLDARL